MKEGSLKYKLWFDISNSPHVLFFKPIIDILSNEYEIVITSRDFSHTIELLRSFGINSTIIGKHDGKNKFRKILGLFKRAFELRSYIKDKGNISLSISHNSYHQILASKILKIKSITFMDFEGQIANHIAFRLSDKVVVPKYFKREYLKIYGAKNVRFYSGLKEEVYLWNFYDSKDYILELGISRDLPVCVVRPPAISSLYYKNNNLFYEVLKYVSKFSKVILIPREKNDIYKLGISKLLNENIFIPNKALNGPRLLYWSDFVISGGGTMNRESALLGTKAYSIFQGIKSGVDEYLESIGMLKYINHPTEIKIEKKTKFEKLVNEPTVLNEIVEIIRETIKTT
ncbi:MAG: DUF354 domain-containing protein [candidate division WOR-3 bacterium]|nr:DUF354 domain-containing protein [candidate division WOR-3 bacterium]MDW8150145.1 DUF354 domain-containing protein [candidate division WOR-3 bacterium]